jgi:hypothetical protein
MSVELRYPGHRPFQRADSGRFYGRDEEAAALAAAWRSNRLTFVSGPAGVGKSSLLAAGVLPLVNRSNVELLPIGGFSQGSSSPIAPPGPHTPYTLALLRSWSPLGAGLTLDPFTVDEFAASRIRQLDPSKALLVAIDQADDLFAGPPSRQPQRMRFLRELADAVEQQPALRLLICLRDEALHRFADVLAHPAALIEVRALEPDRAREAVTGPGCFEPEAASELIAALRTSRIVTTDGSERHVVADRVEPVLIQSVCARLWELMRRRTSMITARELRRYGDIEDALARYCGVAITAAALAHGIQVPWLRFWLISTFVATAGGRLDAAEGAVSTAGLPTTVARALEDGHLLRARAEPPGGAATAPAASRVYQLISDRVIEPLRHTPDDLSPDGDSAGYLLAAERALTVGELSLAARYAELARVAASETDLMLHGSARSLLGNIAREERELARAETHYREALGLFTAAMEHSMVALLLVAIGRILIERGDLLAGINELHAAVQRMPSDATIQTELSAAVRELGWRLPGQNGPRVSPG